MVIFSPFPHRQVRWARPESCSRSGNFLNNSLAWLSQRLFLQVEKFKFLANSFFSSQVVKLWSLNYGLKYDLQWFFLFVLFAVSLRFELASGRFGPRIPLAACCCRRCFTPLEQTLLAIFYRWLLLVVSEERVDWVDGVNIGWLTSESLTLQVWLTDNGILDPCQIEYLLRFGLVKWLSQSNELVWRLAAHYWLIRSWNCWLLTYYKSIT